MLHASIPVVAFNLLIFLMQVQAQENPLDHWALRASGSTKDLLAIAYGHGTYVAVGGLPPIGSQPIRASLLTSTDAVTWTSLPPTNVNIYGVSFLNDQFVAVGDSGLIMTSADGLSWTKQNSSAPNRTSDIYPLGGIAFGNGSYVAMNRLLGNNCLVSTDATNWFTTQLQPGSTAYIEMCRVHFDKGLFVDGRGGEQRRDAYLNQRRKLDSAHQSVTWQYYQRLGLWGKSLGCGRRFRCCNNLRRCEDVDEGECPGESFPGANQLARHYIQRRILCCCWRLWDCINFSGRT